MTPAERIRAALSRYEEQGFASVRLDTLAARVGATDGAVIAEAERMRMTVTRRAGVLWIHLQPVQRDQRALRAARDELEDREERTERLGAGR